MLPQFSTSVDITPSIKKCFINVRRCCRVPRRADAGLGHFPQQGGHASFGPAQVSGLLPFAPDNYPLPPHPSQLPPGFTVHNEEPSSFIVNPAHHQEHYQPGKRSLFETTAPAPSVSFYVTLNHAPVSLMLCIRQALWVTRLFGRGPRKTSRT